MIVEIAAVAAAVKHLLDIGKTAHDAESIDVAKEQLTALVSGLNSVLLDLGKLQADRIEALREHGELIQKVAKLEALVAELSLVRSNLDGYVFDETELNFPLYKRRPSGNPETTVDSNKPDRICATCYQEQKESALQYVRTFSDGAHYRCLRGHEFIDPMARSKLVSPVVSVRSKFDAFT